MRKGLIKPNVSNYEPICLTETECHLLAICINCHLLRCNDCIYFCTTLVKRNFILMSKLNRIYLLIVVFLCLTLFNCKSQNLLANSSFENYNTPVNWNLWGGDFIGYYSNPADTVMVDWKQYQSPDFFTSACPHAYSGVPVNLFGYSQAKDGNNYVGLYVFSYGGLYREYIYQKFTAPLIAGRNYCLSFYVSRGDRCQYASKNIEAYFTASLPYMATYFNIPASPQIVNQTGFISDTTQWTNIQGCYTAIGGEKYIIIGNFKNDTNTDTLYVGTNNPDPNYPGLAQRYSYYYIDDVTLIDQTTVGLNEINENNAFEIYPNPTTGLLNFSGGSYRKGDYNVKILDLFGKEIINDVLKEELDISSFDKGVYTLLIYKNKQLVVTKKVMKD